MIASVCQVVGLIAIAVGVALFVPWLGLIVAGVELVAVGVALEFRSSGARESV